MTLPAHAMDEQPTSPEIDPSAGAIFTAHRRTQFLVVIASAVCFLLFWLGGQWLRIPTERGFEASLLQQPNWALVMLAAYVMLICSATIGALIAGRSWFFAGLFTAAFGLIALSARGGPMRYVLFEAASHGPAQRVFLVLLLEQCLLFIPIALLWTFFWGRYEAVTLDAASAKKDPPATPATPLTILAQIGIMGVVVLLLAATDAKKQVLVSVFLAGLAGTALADYLFPDRKAPGWFWVGPFVVGAVGYVLAYINSAPLTIGIPGGTLGALARPLPLDYASAGIAGALLGYWIGGERTLVPFSLRRRPPTVGTQESQSNAPRTEQQEP